MSRRLDAAVRASAWAIIRAAVHAGHHRAQASALPIGDPVVDGRGAGDGEEDYVAILGLVRGVHADAERVCIVKVLDVARDRYGDVLVAPRPGGDVEVIELTDAQVGRRLGISARLVSALVNHACHVVYENCHRRLDATAADVAKDRRRYSGRSR